MIINKEQLELGNGQKKLVVSYVDKAGGIKFLQYVIPQEQMFEWHYTTQKFADKPFYEIDNVTKQPKTDENGNPIIRQWKSYDNKYVKKVFTDKKLKDFRIVELLNSFGDMINPIYEMNIPKTYYCDIETDVSDDGFSDPEDALNPINTISLTRFPETIIFSRKNLTPEEQDYVQHQIDNYSYNNNGSDITKGYKFIFKYYQSEREMLEAFVEYILDIPAITGWNFLGFDWLYIFNRCKMHNIDLRRLSPTNTYTPFKITPRSGGKTINVELPTHKIIYDYLMVYKTWDQSIEPKENNTLDFVAERALGIKKVKHKWGFKEFYEEHFADYVFYNCIDTILVEHIDKVLKTSEIWYMLTSVLRIELNMAFSTIKPTEHVMCNFMYPQYKIFPVIKKAEVEQSDYEGAFVWPTRPGIFKFIGGLDFASLYPSIIRQFLISPEMFLFKNPSYIPKKDEIKTKSGAVFKKSNDSIIPSILTHYFGLRKAAKNDKKDCNVEMEHLKHILEKRKGVI